MRRASPLSRLDQSDDPLGSSYADTVALYDAYQGKEYGENYYARRAAWEEHYNWMRMATDKFIWKVVERSRKPRNDMVMAVVGPGMQPAERDFDKRLIDTTLSELRAMILVDFSRLTNATAVRSLTEKGPMDPQRLHTVQYDVTHGMSTMYLRYIQESLAGVDCEEKLADAVAKLAEEDTVHVLRTRLHDERDKTLKAADQPNVGWDVRMRIQEMMNPKHTLHFTANERAVPVDMLSLNMILAGTGAAADGLVWDKFYGYIASANLTGRPTPETQLNMRKRVLRDMHTVITRYNNDVAKEIFRAIFDAHPNARVLAMTDISTVYNDEEHDVGRLSRLDTTVLSEDCLAMGIELTVARPLPNSRWRDEPEHEHETTCATAKKLAPEDLVMGNS
jgi:hypothetical protein